MGIAYREKGLPQDALRCLEASLAIKHEFKSIRGAAMALNNIAMVYWSTGDRLKAKEYYEQARLTFQQVEDRFGEATALFNIARVDLEMNDAAGFYADAPIVLAMAQEHRFIEIIAEIYRLMGKAALDTNKSYEEAFDLFSNSLTHARQAREDIFDQVRRRVQIDLAQAYDLRRHRDPQFIEPLIDFWQKWALDSTILDRLSKARSDIAE